MSIRVRIVVLTMLGALSMATGVLAILLLRMKQYRIQWDKITDANTQEGYISPASVVIDRSFSSLAFDGFLVAIVMFLLVGVVAHLYSYQITSPINSMVSQLSEIANGNGEVTERIDMEYKHDVGILAAHLNRILDNLQRMRQRIAAESQRVAKSSEALVVASSDMLEITNAMSIQQSHVAEAVQTITKKMGMIASVSKIVSYNSESIAVSIEALTITLRQLQATAEQASSISMQTEKLVGRKQLMHQRLMGTSNEICFVNDVLESLRERIHVLALNATLAAARSGDVGNGFSVVAMELKQLEKQTVDTTEVILERMRDIQDVSFAACNSMTELDDVAQSVGIVSNAVASVVEEQNIVTQSIFQRLRETSTNVNSVTSEASHTAICTEEISLQIEGLSLATQNSSQNSVRTRNIGDDLLKLSASLQSSIAWCVTK